VVPVVFFKVNDGAIILCLLVFLILRLDNGRCLEGAPLEELKAFAAL
jgi:hypothetical protein